MHRCTDEDYEELWPAKTSQIDIIQNEKRIKQLYCIDKNETIRLFG